jgi:hypothetical protein
MSVDTLLEALCKEYTLSKTRNKFKYKLTTPFSMPNGELIEFIIMIINDNEILLDDMAFVYRYYDMNFFDPKSNALDKITDICKSFAVSTDSSFTKLVNVKSPYAIYDVYDFINALIRLSDVVFFKPQNREKSHFIEDLIGFVKTEINAQFKFISAGIKPFDKDDEFKVDIALSNNKINWVVVNGVLNHSQALETNLSIIHYKYELNIDVESILVFENLDQFSKGKKINRLLNYADTTIPHFDATGQKRLKEIAEKRLK